VEELDAMIASIPKDPIVYEQCRGVLCPALLLGGGGWLSTNGEYTFHNVPVEPPHCALIPCSASLMHIAILSKDGQGNDENDNARQGYLTKASEL
jgi:hypothetical protein